MSDFFVSFNSADQTNATKIAEALKNAGFTVRFWPWEIGLGNDIAIWMSDALQESDRLIAVTSSNYLKPSAKYSALERAAMLWTDIDGKDGAVIPIKVESCELPVIFGARSYYDLTKGDLAGFIKELQAHPRNLPP